MHEDSGIVLKVDHRKDSVVADSSILNKLGGINAYFAIYKIKVTDYKFHHIHGTRNSAKKESDMVLSFI